MFTLRPQLILLIVLKEKCTSAHTKMLASTLLRSVVYVANYNSISFIHSFFCSPQVENRAPFDVSVITPTVRHKAGLLRTSDQPVAEASTYTEQHNV
jgi:hypothetical protein